MDGFRAADPGGKKKAGEGRKFPPAAARGGPFDRFPL